MGLVKKELGLGSNFVAKPQLSIDQKPGCRVGILKGLMIRLKTHNLESGLRIIRLRMGKDLVRRKLNFKETYKSFFIRLDISCSYLPLL